MLGNVPGIHVFSMRVARKSWMAGSNDEPLCHQRVRQITEHRIEPGAEQRLRL
jgi:hypothetical protein